MARIYHWQDTGSPGRSLSGNASARLRTILLACLVNGYQGKPPAGWTLVHDATGGFSLRNGPGTGIINLSDFSTLSYGTLQVTLLETVTGNLTSPIPSGDNLRSGAGAPSSAPHQFSAYSVYNFLSSAVWTVVADEKSFCLFIGGNTQDSTATGYTGHRSGWLYAGETTEGRFVAFGGQNASTATAGTWPGNGFTVLRDPATGLVISGAGGELQGGGIDTVQATLGVSDSLGRLDLAPYPLIYGDRVTGAAAAVGSLRGVVFSPRHLRLQDSSAQALLGLANSADNRGKPAVVGGMTLMAVAGGIPQTCRCFLTDHADYW